MNEAVLVVQDLVKVYSGGWLTRLRMRLVVLNLILGIAAVLLVSAPALAEGSKALCALRMEACGCEQVDWLEWGECQWHWGCGGSPWADDWCFGGTMTGTNCTGCEEPVICSWSGCSGCC
jgi:hypothetical protein